MYIQPSITPDSGLQIIEKSIATTDTGLLSVSVLMNAVQTFFYTLTKILLKL
ncbi:MULTISPECIES: hypothetical protein [Nostocaceae]|uniref:Uncharacterized protein n=2 Tax=Nostocaceae TaxID=1162 RepID=A0A1Z4KJT1_ANAVA|nr:MULTISPECIES: hypothetical protein [Nostocaceae]BAY69226.1 hypothetical protein NIES23_20190 [Trichormus variabilis NIES-23]MBD2174833.1 hypothetical protein [Anabaena cylindrica FACHB-318]MBD2276186.1 hypothetical protein [Nostoc sp. PCC 7120 = FACHB-418]MBD2286831.1 hypothetical protein [Anabaena cylindrica FACHB-170]RUR74155.1 hypothetical protein DSM107007_51900 [Nostoc sp. PCC 7120 = FACHB-418]